MKTKITILILAVLLSGQVRWNKLEKRGAVVAEVETVWTNGSGDRDWDNAANWSGAVPVNGATTYIAIFDGDVSNVSPNTGLAQSLDTINQLTFLESYTAGIGSLGSPLEIEIDSTGAPSGGDLSRNCTVLGGGNYYFKFTAAGFTDVVVDKPRDGTKVFLTGASSIRNLYAKNGEVDVGTLCNLSVALMVFGNSRVTVAVPTAAASPGIVYIESGELINNRVSSNNVDSQIIVAGGYLSWRASITNNCNIMVNGGLFEWQPTSAPGTVPDLFAMKGIVDLSKSSFKIDFTSFVVGPLCEFITSPSVGTVWSGAATVVDLREVLP